MTNDTSYRQKGRAVFLAAIMVLSMVAGAAVLTGSVAAEHDDPTPASFDVTDTDDEDTRYWVGQEVNVSGFTEGDTVEFSNDEDFFQRTANENGSVTVDTSNWETGTWNVEGAGENSSFVLSNQELSTFEFSEDSTEGNADLSISSNRAEYNVSVSADGLSTDDLETIFADDYVASHDGHVVLNVTDGVAEITGSFSDVEAGNYTFEANVIDSTASATANITVEEDAGVDGEFDQGTYNQEAGDVVDFGFETTDVDTAYVQVVGDHDVYNVTFNVSGYEGNTASLSMNSYLAGQENITDTFSAEDGSIENVSDDTDADALDEERLKPSRLNIYLYDDDPTTGDGDQLDRGIIRLQDGSLESATTYSASGDLENSDIPTTDLTQRSETTVGDKVVTQIEATGVYGYLTNDSDVYTAENGLRLTLNDTEDPIYGGADGLVVDETTEGVDIVPDAQNDTFYVVVDPADIGDLETGESWSTTFTMTEDNSYVDEETSVNSTFEYTERTLEFDLEEADSGALQVSDGTISGTSSALPGSEVTVSAFFETEILDDTAEVGEDGSWSTEFNLSGYETGNTFTIETTQDDATTGEEEAVITGADGETGSSFTVDASLSSDTVTAGESATLEYTISNDGDAAGETNYTVTVDGEEVDSGTADLEAGNSTETMSYEDFDTSSAGDISWEVSTGDDSVTGTLTVEEENGTDTGGDDTGGDDTGGDDTGNGTDGDGDDGDDGGQPGFGLVVALFALIGAALLALRRQN